MVERILNISGGKDSAYLTWFCKENNIHVDRYQFYDTKAELPIVYEYLYSLEVKLDIKIERIVATREFDEYFHKIIGSGKLKGSIRGFPYTTLPGCWVSRDIKFRGIDNKASPDAEYLMGYCADENRSLKEVNAVYPLVEAGITERQVIRECKRLGLYPPLYYLLEKYGAKKPRSGCWFCPKCSIPWVKLLYCEYPEL